MVIHTPAGTASVQNDTTIPAAVISRGRVTSHSVCGSVSFGSIVGLELYKMLTKQVVVPHSKSKCRVEEAGRAVEVSLRSPSASSAREDSTHRTERV
jgi:hypothetical protein